ncbi:MAG: hypothetical protein JJT94_05695, partial [Bernardetiaceae bacterium]|nr:hypothetical protein [Bernardetiaceae bacterium]
AGVVERLHNSIITFALAQRYKKTRIKGKELDIDFERFIKTKFFLKRVKILYKSFKKSKLFFFKKNFNPSI